VWRVGRGAGEEELVATGGDSCNWDLDLPRSTVNIQSKMTGQRLSDAHSSSAHAAHTQPPTTLYTLNNNNNEWRW
jgi:hypothetical protein